MDKLKNKHVFVTGGSAGLGLSIAKEAYRRGAHVTIVARREGPLQEAVKEIKNVAGGQASQIVNGLVADCADAAAISKTLDQATSIVGLPPYLIVCNAGTSRPMTFIDHNAKDFEDLMRANYLTAAYTAHAGVKHLLATSSVPEARIVMVSSLAGLVGFAGYSTYSPTKSAIISLADCMRHELLGGRARNIKVHVFLPGSIATPGFEQEQQIKPQLTKTIERDDPILSADDCAAALYRGLDAGHFQITTGGFIPELLRCARMTHAPCNNAILDYFKYLLAWIMLTVWRLADLDAAAKKMPAVPMETDEHSESASMKSKGKLKAK